MMEYEKMGINSGIWGEILDNDDPMKIGRLRVRVKGWYDEIEEENIPWSLPLQTQYNTYNPPPIGAIVQIAFMEGNILVPIWYAFNGSPANEIEIDDTEYVKGAMIFYKDLEEYNAQGKGIVKFTDSDGFQIEYENQDNTRGRVQVRKDNSIVIENETFGKMIHVAEQSISLGSEDQSAEPATLGQTNHDALDMINETIKEASEIIEMYGDTMFNVCIGSSVLRPLAAPSKILMTQLKAKISTAAFNRNKNFFPRTKSEIVSLD